MITKQQAQALASRFNEGLSDRVSRFLQGLAEQGVLGGVIQYQGSPPPGASAVAAELSAAGWDVAHDTNAKTFTITPKP